MKVSRYNFVFPSGNRFVLYNSVSDYMTQIESRLMDVYNQYEKEPDKIYNIAPDFYQFLCDKGFLVNNEANETENNKIYYAFLAESGAQKMYYNAAYSQN